MLPSIEKPGFIWVTGLFCGMGFAETEPVKPDLQKIYNEALTWSKTKIEETPVASGVCIGATAGERLSIAPPCKKTKALDVVLDNVTDYDKTSETRRNVHADILTGSTKLPVPKLLVFVSFSMPKASLRSLAKSAADHNAVLVMQGLKDDSFKITQAALQELIGDVKEEPGLEQYQGFEVNPELFKTYKIIKVPVFVLIEGDKEISRLSGNVSLDFAAKKLKETV